MSKGRSRLGGRLAELATSRRAALVLMAFFFGSLVIQALLPQRGTVTELEYAYWKAHYPLLSWAAELLGLNSVASTPWFWAIGLSLAGSMAFCTGRRGITLLRHGPGPFGQENVHNIGPDIVLGDVARAAGRLGYSVTPWGDGFRAVKGSLGPAGSVAFHAGLVLLFAGGVVSAATRFSGFMELAPGQVFEESRGYQVERGGALASRRQGLSVAVSEMGAAFWPDGSVKDIWAKVAMREGPGRASEGTMRRNDSLAAGESALSLGSPFGPAALLSYRPAAGGQPLQGYVHFPAEGPASQNRFVVPGASVEVDAELVGPWRSALAKDSPAGVSPIVKLALSGLDADETVRELALGESVPLAAGELCFVGLEPWALFMVTRDQGMPFLITGGLVALAGLAVALFVTPRFLQLERVAGGWRLVGRAPSAAASFARELYQLVQSIEMSNHA